MTGAIPGSFALQTDEFICIKGDVNNDAKIDVINVIHIVAIILGYLDNLTEWQLCCSDYNSDGEINVKDIVEIVNNIMRIR